MAWYGAAGLMLCHPGAACPSPASPICCARSDRLAFRLRTFRGGHLRPLLRHHPRRGRPVPLHAGGGARCRAHDPRLRHGGDCRRDLILPRFHQAARDALLAGAPILCDAQMVAHGITRPRLPAGNEVVCTLDDPAVPALAARIGNTRSAAALDLWGPRLGGALVAIGNAPTALFHLLELLDAGAPRPPP